MPSRSVLIPGRPVSLRFLHQGTVCTPGKMDGPFRPGYPSPVHRPPSSPWPPFLLLAGSTAALAFLGPHRATLVPALLPWALAWVALLRLWNRHGAWLDRPRVLVGGALLLRLLFLPTLPDLSDDLFRYVWDGWLSVQGLSPYGHPPSDPSLSTLHDSVLFQGMNSPEYHSIYPPLSQLVFLPGGWIHTALGWPASGWAVKGGFLLLETLGALLLIRTLARDGRPVRSAALYAWNPLVLLVVAGGGHTEGGLVLGLALLLAGVGARASGVAWSGWVLAVLSKGFPVLLVPLVWRALRAHLPVGRTLSGAVPPALGALLLAGIFLRPQELVGVLASARLYVQLFEFNAGLYLALTHLAQLLTGHGWGHRIGPALAVVFLAGGLLLVLRHPVRDLPSAARAILLVHSLHLLTATTVHPWYLLWVLPLLPFTTTLRNAWLWASAAAFPTYLTYAGVSHGALTALFWGGWLALALQGEREWVLGPLRRLAARRKAAWVLPHLRGPLVLDVGGSEGALARILVRHGLRVTVLDPSPGPCPPPRATGVGEAIPVGPGGVDTVLLAFVLHHTRDPDRVLEEALRVARRRVVILESTYRWRAEGWVLERLDRWLNARRGGPIPARGEAASPPPGPEPPIAYRTPLAWEEAIRLTGGRILLSDRPNRWGHRVLRLVVEVPTSHQTG